MGYIGCMKAYSCVGSLAFQRFNSDLLIPYGSVQIPHGVQEFLSRHVVSLVKNKGDTLDFPSGIPQ